MSTSERALVTSERIFAALRRKQAINVLLAGRLATIPSAGALRRALDRLQARHPLLRVRIVDDERPRLTATGVGPIPVRIIERRAPDALASIVEDELNRPFEAERGPLIRAVLLRDAEFAELALVWDHSIADGVAGRVAFGDLLRGLAEPERELGELAQPEPIDALLSVRELELRPGVRAARRTIAGAQRLEPRVRRVLGEPAAASADRTTRVELRSVRGPDLQRLRARAREHGTTIYGALAAAAALALVAGAGPRWLRTVAITSAADVRAQLGLGEVFGNYNLGPSYLLRVGARAGLWPLAGEARTRLRAGLGERNLARFAKLLALTDAGVELLDSPLAEAGAQLTGARHLGLSNLGAVEFGEAGVAAGLGPCLFAASIQQFDLAVFAVGHADALELCFAYLAARLEPRAVRAIADHCVALLRAA